MSARSYLMAGLLLGVLMCPLHATDPTPTPAAPAAAAGSAPVMDPKVEATLSACANFYTGLSSFEGDIASTTKMEMTGIKQEMDSSFHLALSRPASFALVKQDGMMGGTMISDGKTWVTYQSILRKYTSTDAPAQLSDLLQPMNLTMAVGGLPLGIEPFLGADPMKNLKENLVKSEDIGPEKIGDTPAEHVRLTKTPYITDYWIEDGATPFLLQTLVAQDMTGVMKALTPELKAKLPPGFSMTSMTRMNVFSNWKSNVPIPAATFQFQPPADAKLVDELVTQSAHPLVGKSAPDFTLKGLDGQSVSPASLRGKVVVLDFWATWCGPCVASLPTVSEVTSSLKDRGVVFYAVNLKETADQIRKFQKEKNLAFSVLLDPDGAVADLYLAKAIPESVLIDATGKIEAVHVGYDPNLKKALTQQLNDMLDGKPLAAPSPDLFPAAKP